MKRLEGLVALVTGGGTPLGRAVAEALAADGARILVTGKDEPPLGVTVGEIVHGGGKARHSVGDVQDLLYQTQVIARAIELFGRLDVVVVGAESDMSWAVRSGIPTCQSLLLVVDDGTLASAWVSQNKISSGSLGTCNAIAVARDGLADEVAVDVGALAAFLCSAAGRRITGRVLSVG
jgi:NAD(P)-dependent dehydrogenase (short-subunit alcohol dehydrogenase family)